MTRLTYELLSNTITGILDEVINGSGYVVDVLGPPGIGKSRLVRETAGIAAVRGVPVVTTYCESHAADVPFHVVARLLRSATGVDDLDPELARNRVRELFSEADSEDLLLLDDLLGVRDSSVALPEIAPDARRRRLTALIIGASLATQEPTVYVIEDAQWIDEVSESMLAEFFAVIPQTPSMVLITYRPEYRGALTRIPGAQTLALRPLRDAQALALTAELLGADSSVSSLTTTVAERAAGNPFFAEEIVRDLAERGLLEGELGAYRLRGGVSDVDVPATLQATIGARIDRIDPTAKAALNAAAVIGARFDMDLLNAMAGNADMAPLIEAELVDQVRFSPRAEYAFRHPLIRTVAYESQLKADRAQLHRRLAAAIESRGSADENAALIAEHLEAAGELHEAFEWHMRAGSWLTNRDIAAALTSWRRAQQVADRLPQSDPGGLSMRIAPRTLLCASGFRVGGRGAVPAFDELRDLCTAAGDQRSLAIAMSGQVMEQFLNGHRHKASQLVDEQVRLLESIGDPTLTVALLSMAFSVKVETLEVAHVLRLAQRVIDLAGGDVAKGHLLFPSLLTLAIAMRGLARSFLGIACWREDMDQAVVMACAGEPVMRVAVIWYTHIQAIINGVLLPGDTVLHETAEALFMAEQSGEDTVLTLARNARGVVLLHESSADLSRDWSCSCRCAIQHCTSGTR